MLKKRVIQCLMAVFSAVSVAVSTGASADPLAPDKCGRKGNEACIQIGTFNIKWFGTPNKGPERTKQESERLADMVSRDIDLDLVALIEINPDSQQFEWFRERLKRNDYEVLYKKQDQQSIVIAYDSDQLRYRQGSLRLLAVRDEFDLPEGCKTGRELRRPLAADFSAGDFDITFVGVHLKSQIGGYCADAIRSAQMSDLREALDKLRDDNSDLDVVVAGDFNAQLTDPSASPLSADRRYWFLTEPRFRQSSSGELSYIAPPFEGVIDHILIMPEVTLEWVPASTVIYRPAGADSISPWYLERMSDHVPVWSSFYTKKN